MAALENGKESLHGKFERRERGRRYRIAAAVTFCWQTSSGEWRQGTGVSRDIGAYGISVVTSCIPIPGASLEMTVNLPVPWARASCLRGRGVVVRLLPEAGQPWGFAASLCFDEEVQDGDSDSTGQAESPTYTAKEAEQASPMSSQYGMAGNAPTWVYRTGSLA